VTLGQGEVRVAVVQNEDSRPENGVQKLQIFTGR
jgi:hypothetical protein